MNTTPDKFLVPFLHRMITLCVFLLAAGLLLYLTGSASFITEGLLTSGIGCLLAIPLILLVRFAIGFRQANDLRMTLWIILMMIFLFAGTGILYLFKTM